MISLVDLFIGLAALFFFLLLKKNFFYFNSFFNFIFLIFKFFFFLFFLPFLLSRVADRVLVLWPAVRTGPLRWESRVQDFGPPETSWPHVISIGERCPRDLYLNGKTQLHSTASKLQCWTPHAKQLARQEHNPIH